MHHPPEHPVMGAEAVSQAPPCPLTPMSPCSGMVRATVGPYGQRLGQVCDWIWSPSTNCSGAFATAPTVSSPPRPTGAVPGGWAASRPERARGEEWAEGAGERGFAKRGCGRSLTLPVMRRRQSTVDTVFPKGGSQRGQSSAISRWNPLRCPQHRAARWHHQKRRSFPGPDALGSAPQSPRDDGRGVALVGVPVAIGALGFTAAGITAGSVAAKMMSAGALANGGGAAGLSIAAKIGLTSVLGSLGAAVVSKLFEQRLSPCEPSSPQMVVGNCRQCNTSFIPKGRLCPLRLLCPHRRLPGCGCTTTVRNKCKPPAPSGP
ncbi:PREDICTED: uncharacterized protein LOC104288067 [Charadrius vociferus]|uniref:uncharacterized protein LOC104288067 n=1 Tax=Charadrius vociferus TaxID=50402 RepID=UPI000521479F|nr:PREDICTED: uncharacterized protein LOC104288067 [Charadrius vociferus]